ncbi:MAG: metallophosphoesterase [Candidatus Omnitrophota bacterium]|nr:metallophosphoesterase [Candidatus Omnitrophota bacterium]
MKQNFRWFPLLILVAVTLNLGADNTLSDRLACLIPYQLFGYRSGKVMNAEPTLDFTVPVQNGDGEYLQFFALGCSGSGNKGQKLVAGRMAAIADQGRIAFVLYLGDNFYGCGVSSVSDPQWQTKFEAVYHQPSLQIPFYAALGNHDYLKNSQAQVDYTGTQERWRMPDRYYTFSENVAPGVGVDFFAIDTEALLRGKAAEQIAWLDEKLGQSTARWKLVFGHHPVYTGSPDNDIESEVIREILEPLFDRHKIDAYISADSHTLEVHRSPSGLYYIVSGASSRPRTLRWEETTVFASAELGFVLIRLSKTEMTVQFIDAQGGIDYVHTIQHK